MAAVARCLWLLMVLVALLAALSLLRFLWRRFFVAGL